MTAGHQKRKARAGSDSRTKEHSPQAQRQGKGGGGLQEGKMVLAQKWWKKEYEKATVMKWSK